MMTAAEVLEADVLVGHDQSQGRGRIFARRSISVGERCRHVPAYTTCPSSERGAVAA